MSVVNRENTARFIVFGNEKGGSGKTTLAVHVSIGLLKLGYKVCCIDLDTYQGSMSRYFDNRQNTINQDGLTLVQPQHFLISNGSYDEQIKDLNDKISIANKSDFVIIDTPGSNTQLNSYGHGLADIVVTPINDSFIDLDTLGKVGANAINAEETRVKEQSFSIPDPYMISPGVYSAMLFNAQLRNLKDKRKKAEWFVVRNRISSLDSINGRKVAKFLEQIAKRIGFKVGPGLSDRVIFRELFPKGLTVHDVLEIYESSKITPSILAARQEVRLLIQFLGLLPASAT